MDPRKYWTLEEKKKKNLVINRRQKPPKIRQRLLPLKATYFLPCRYLDSITDSIFTDTNSEEHRILKSTNLLKFQNLNDEL